MIQWWRLLSIPIMVWQRRIQESPWGTNPILCQIFRNFAQKFSREIHQWFVRLSCEALTEQGKIWSTRMHSSKMCAIRCSSRLLGGGVSAPVHAGIHPPPACGQNYWHMLVKTLPFRNLVYGRWKSPNHQISTSDLRFGYLKHHPPPFPPSQNWNFSWRTFPEALLYTGRLQYCWMVLIHSYCRFVRVSFRRTCAMCVYLSDHIDDQLLHASISAWIIKTWNAHSLHCRM